MGEGSNGVDGDHLRAFIERIEKLEEEKRSITDDVKEIYVEAKGMGFDPRIIREVIRIRNQDKSKREEFEAVLELYLNSLGDFVETDLGRASMPKRNA
jgi:uncharacterized protein (UPF0335 family)